MIQAYHGLLMVGRYPMAIVFVDLPPESVDVNVHPAKAEVRFVDPRRVFSVVQRSVRATLLNEAPPPDLDLGEGWADAGRDHASPAGEPGGKILGSRGGCSPSS